MHEEAAPDEVQAREHGNREKHVHVDRLLHVERRLLRARSNVKS